MNFDLLRLRERFPTLQHKHYLNSGSYGLLSVDVRAAFDEYLSSRERDGSDWGQWLEKCESVRTLLAELICARPDCIAITASASAGINALATAIPFVGKRRKIVVSDFEFPTCGQIWHAQEARGALVEHVPETADGYIPLEHFERAIDDSTALVAVSHVCYRNGAMLDIPRIAKMAHAKGALVLLDCYQSIGVTDIDVNKLDVDFAVGGMLKYLLGTAGIGFIFARPDLVTQLFPSVTGWFAQAAPDAMDIYHHVPAPNGRRFQAGTPPVAACYAAAAGLKIILQIGSANVEQYVRDLTGACMDRLRAMNVVLATPRADGHRGPQIAIRSNNEAALVTALAAKDIVVSGRAGNVRAMFHCYNSTADIDALLEGLRSHPMLLVRD